MVFYPISNIFQLLQLDAVAGYDRNTNANGIGMVNPAQPPISN